MKGADRRLKRRQYIARKLLIELLACQFAFPVRWIETQNEVFSKDKPISRFVEIGPAKVLARMAKQTADSRYTNSDRAKSIQRKFLSSQSDEKDVCYEYEPEEEQGSSHPPIEPTSLPPSNVPEPTKQLQSAISVPAAPATATPPPDTAVSAQEVIQSLIARKFNKSFGQLSTAKSIKDLTGGKSALQNELVGLLEIEFATLPSAPEDQSISQLGVEIQQSFSGNLGKESSRLISRFFSAKMPSGFAQNDVRSYLEKAWNLGSGRQTSILLFAVTAEPASRLPSVDSAREFFDSIVMQYASVTGAVLSKATTSGGQENSATAMMDSKELKALCQEQNRHLSKHFRILGEHLGINISNDQSIQKLKDGEPEASSKLRLWSSEFEEEFEAGIQPAFDPRKIRHFDSWWNNVRQDIIGLFHKAQNLKHPIDKSTLDGSMLHIANRSDDFVCKLVDHLSHAAFEKSSESVGASRAIAAQLSAVLQTAKNKDPVFKFTRRAMAPLNTIDQAGIVHHDEVPRESDGTLTYLRLLRSNFSAAETDRYQPFINVQRRCGSQWNFDPAKTEILFETFAKGGSSGISFAGKNILLTGAGPKSIGAEVLRGLLMGGARVIVTSSRQPTETKGFYQSIYEDHGARGSELTVIPFNQGSKCDCTALINHIYEESGMNRNLDAIIPFAAISERAEIDGIGSRSELAHRLMLINVLRILGNIVRKKSVRSMNTRPTLVLLPLSPNHGMFGGDGLYAESKLGLESLLSRYHSETWSDYLQICGAVIGWTRGTELMSDTDIVAQSIESQNVLTFSQSEMAFNLLTLMTESVTQMCEHESILVDLSGGLDSVPDLKDILVETRAKLNHMSAVRKAIVAEDAQEAKAVKGDGSDPSGAYLDQHAKRSTIRVGYPSLPDFEKDIAPLHHLEGMVDLSSVPVVVGFSEIGPWGSSRTRWEMETSGTFSQEGYIEMAWMMNLIKYFNGEKGGEHYAGWVDVKTGAEVQDSQVEKLYGRQILEHAGIRLVEPGLRGGYDPSKKEYLHEIAVEETLPEFNASRAAAEAFKLYHGDKVAIRQIEGSDEFRVQLKAGASVMVSKAVPFEGCVAGQIPTGWDATKYGLPEDLVQQIDPVTAYALCCTAEALYSAGISDASEILQHIHISETGNFVGSMMGGTTKTRNMYKDRYLDKDVQGDVMQETYLNTTAAWINMLLLGAAGPIKTPSGACATGIESIDSACESLLSGKTKLCFAGGTDDFQEDESYAFRTMNATVNANEEFAKGRLPSEMSRPTSDTRSGFVEGQGSGIHIITTADVALSLGLPIYGVIAASTMAADKISRSVPAPGQGVLSFARQTSEAFHSPLLNMEYRRHEMKTAIARTHAWRTASLHEAYRNANKHTQFVTGTDIVDTVDSSRSLNRASLSTTVDAINRSTNSQIREIQRLWGNDFRRQNPDISPLQAALGTWGLTINDIDFVSLHATSTKANDKNEPDIVNKQMSHLNRTLGNPLLAICQKSVTGHPKAPAAAFMLNGCLQALDTGFIPGNRNADNVDPLLSAFPHLTFPTRSIPTNALKAFSLTSFGFGQKGGQLIGIHPRYLYGTIDRASYETYTARVINRTRLCNCAYLSAMLENRIVACKSEPQYAPTDQDTVFLDPQSRISAQTPQGEQWRYVMDRLNSDRHKNDPVSEARCSASECDDADRSSSQTSISLMSNSSNVDADVLRAKTWLEDAVARVQPDHKISVGIDVEGILSTEDISLEGTFVQRNYTAEERAFAERSPDPQWALTGRWSAKEAVFKSLGVRSKGAGAPMRDIEILSGKEGTPTVKLHGDAYVAAQEKGITDIQLSLSHNENAAIAVALAIKDSEERSHQGHVTFA